jgi:uncharacterized protein with HEPN domain
MKSAESRARLLVDRKLREARAAGRYVARGKEQFFDVRTPEFRDAAELRALHFTETGVMVGQSVRKANPMIPWREFDQRRNDLVHDYPEVEPERVRRIIHDDLHPIAAKLRRARFQGSED